MAKFDIMMLMDLQAAFDAYTQATNRWNATILEMDYAGVTFLYDEDRSCGFVSYEELETYLGC